MKVLTIVGTRPEIIRLSRVISRLDSAVEHVLVHTGQNDHPRLNDIFFEDLDLRLPDHFLRVDTSSLGRVLGGTLIAAEEVLAAERPEAVVVLGDTNSCIAALMAKRMRIPVYHMEAGNRCFDQNVPEETNRRLVDHVADFNLVYTEHARRNLLVEGLHPRRILLTGSPMREVLDHYRSRIEASAISSWLGVEPRSYLLLSVHREENVDDPQRLRMVLACINAVRERLGLRVLVSTHPRTRKRLDALGEWNADHGVEFHDPFGFLDYIKLQTQAACVLSDSGTIAEESAILGFPAVTLRESIERPEALEAAAITTTGLVADVVCRAVDQAIAQHHAGVRPAPIDAYDTTNCSRRVLNFILSTAHVHHEWAGIRHAGTG